MTKKIKVKELIQDSNNANKGTERGMKALEDSLRKYGTGRSILVDKKGRIIAGNKTAEKAAALGIEDVVLVETDGKKIIAVQRTDLDLETDNAARELAYADNRVAELDLAWDNETIRGDLAAGVSLDDFFNAEEMKKIKEEKGKNSTGFNSLNLDKPPEMAWILIGIPIIRFGEIQEKINEIAENSSVFMESTVSDDQKDG